MYVFKWIVSQYLIVAIGVGTFNLFSPLSIKYRCCILVSWFWFYVLAIGVGIVLIFPLRCQLIAALVLVFTSCFVYEQYEEKIDATAVIVYTIASKVIFLLASKLRLSKVSNSSNSVADKGSNRSLLDSRK